MLVSCLPLLGALLVGLPSTATAHTLDHHRLDISGDFGDEHLSKHPTLFVRDPQKDDQFRSPKLDNAPKDFFCPEEFDVAPCICTFNDLTDITMDCSDVESDVQLAAIFANNFTVKEFYMFEIISNDNIQLLSNVFNGVSFRYFLLDDIPNLARITNDAFVDSRDTLETIDIRFTPLTEDTFPFSTLDQYPKLNYLYIDHSNIYLVPAIQSSSLQTLIIENGLTDVLPAGEIYGRPFSNLQINDSKYYYSNLICMLIFTEIDKMCVNKCFLNIKIFENLFFKYLQLLIVVDMFNLILHFK